MKSSYKSNLIIVSILLFLSFFQSCNFGEINVNPNATGSGVVSLDKRLPSLQYDFGRVIGRSVAVRVGNVIGYTFYKQGPTGFNKYVFSPADASLINMWNDLYTLPLNQSYQIIERADQDNNKYYKGIALILQAYTIATISSIWGDVPFSQASQASKYPFPVFDKQENIYAKIQSNLDLAIDCLNSTNGGIRPGSDDIIFKGDLNKWVRTAYSLKARYYLHLVEIDNSNYEKAASALANGLKDNFDNCILNFEEGVPDVNAPLYTERVSGDTQVDTQFGLLLKNTLNDPRLKFFATVKASIVNPALTRAQYGAFYCSKSSYYPFMTFEECEFMRAEILMKSSGKAVAEPALRSAIKASLDRICKVSIGASSTDDLAPAIPTSILGTYVNSVANIDSLPDDSQAWKVIFQQKYVAMFMQTEAWNDYRRTGFYVAGVTGLPVVIPRDLALIPRRFYYPSLELNANSSAPANIANSYQPIWWDKSN